MQKKVLALIFIDPERSFYTSEIVRSLSSGTGGVSRELSRLERSGLVLVKHVGNQRHYQANPSSPIFEELQNIVLKTVAVSEILRRALEPYRTSILAAFIHGSVARDEDTARSDIDVLIIGDNLEYPALYEALLNAEFFLRRPVNPLFLTMGDWRQKSKTPGSFLVKVKARPKIYVYGSDEDINS